LQLSSSPNRAVAAIRAGAHDFLAKPFEIEDLVFRMQKARIDRKTLYRKPERWEPPRSR